MIKIARKSKVKTKKKNHIPAFKPNSNAPGSKIQVYTEVNQGQTNTEVPSKEKYWRAVQLY